MEPFSSMLTGGHPNSLGRTIEVAAIASADATRMDELINCYKSTDEVVRLRTSNAIKRVFVEHPLRFGQYSEDFLTWIAEIDQASTKWTLAQLFILYQKQMNEVQTSRAKAIVINNLLTHNDWIVLCMSMKSCAVWSKKDDTLGAKIIVRVRQLLTDPRKTVAKEAGKLMKVLEKLAAGGNS